MHKLLATQIKRYLKELKEIPPEWKEFVEAVSLAYEEADDDYELMERVMDISSEELMEKNSALVDEVAKRQQFEDTLKKTNLQLEHRVKERTEELYSANEELEIKVDKLNENESRLQTIMDSVIDGIITINEDGMIESLNPATEQIFGYKSMELIGKNITLLMPESYREAHENARRRVKETGEARIVGQYLEVEGLRRDGTAFPLGIAINRMELKGKYIFTGVVRDITDQKQKELEIVQAKEEAERANHAKSEFLSNMSHELRTPMNAILGFSQLLGMNTLEPLNETQGRQVLEIHKAGSHLLKLINEILDLSSIEAGELSLSVENVRLAELVEDTLSLIRPLAEDKSIKIINQIQGLSDIWIFADSTRFKQVLLNLISNSVKYTANNGSVHLGISDPEDGFMTITVEDTGVGIPDDKIKSLFQPFNRLGAEITEVEGTGIGLCITKRIVKMMNGKINVESEIGKGSIFSIQIPEGKKHEILIPGSSPAHQAKWPEESDATIHKLLYVEDNPANLRLVEQVFLKRNDVNLLTAPLAKLGIELARHHLPNLILMDINLPEMDGISALKQLKTYKETRDIPVIAISANANKSDIDKALKAGFEAYVTKPIELKSFLNTVNQFLGVNV